MSGIFVPTLFAICGCLALAAIQHGMAFIRDRELRLHGYFALFCLASAVLVAARAEAYGAETVDTLITLRRIEVASMAITLLAFVFFVSAYTHYWPRIFLSVAVIYWALIFIMNLKTPYGLNFTEVPESLSYIQLPWGETLVDLRVLNPGIWHKIGWLGILMYLGYGLYANFRQYHVKTKTPYRAQSLTIGLTVFVLLVVENSIVNFLNLNFIHTSDFGFLALILLMDQVLTKQSRNEQQQMRDLLDHLPMGIVLKDLRGRPLLTNNYFRETFVGGANSTTGAGDTGVFPTELQKEFAANEAMVIESGQEVEDEYTLTLGSNEQIFRLLQFPVVQIDGYRSGICSVHIDITVDRNREATLQKLRTQVWRSDRLANTSAITKSLAHEICQPLAAILNNAQAGLRFINQPDVDMVEIREILEDIVRDEKRAGAVINGLRAMLQQQEAPSASLNLNNVIAEVIDFLHTEFIQRGVEIDLDLDADLVVWANKTQMQQVALNLIINALEAFDESESTNRVLKIIAKPLNDKAVVVVRDNGPGIPEGKLDLVFDGFYTTKPKGLGVGLEVCRSIMESHGGRIWAENNPDQGVAFTLMLPMMASASNQ